MLATMWGKWGPFALLVGMKIGAATVESSMEILQILKTNLPFDPAITLLGIYPEPKTQVERSQAPLYSLKC